MCSEHFGERGRRGSVGVAGEGKGRVSGCGRGRKGEGQWVWWETHNTYGCIH